MNENVTVCITPKGDKPVLHFSQFDNERVFTVTVLADDGETAAVLTGLDIEFRLRKTDSHVVTIAPESVADNVITFKTTEQLCACCGQNIASVVLMKDDMIISTLDILVDIQRDILSGGLTSESDIRNLTRQIEQIVPEVIGDDYYTKTEVDELIDDIPTFDPTNYYNKSDVDVLLSAKMDNIGYHGVVDDAAVISFTTDCNAPLDIIKGKITPVQDLHGYSKPWSGGGGKNKLNATGTNTYTTLVDGVYTVTSVPQTSGFSWYIGWVDLKAGTYIFNGGFNFYCRCFLKAGDEYYTTQGEDVSFTLTSDTTVAVSGVIRPEATVGNKLKPMIRKTGESADFEPYSNICPISGFSALNVTLADGDMQTVESKTVNFGQTVYGGVLDITNGKLTITHRIINLWDFNFSYNSVDGTPHFTSNSAISDSKNPSDHRTIANILCSQYDNSKSWVSAFGSVGNNGYIALAPSGIFGISDDRYTNPSDFKTALQTENAKLVYELATPIEITTTPETVSSISGDNNIFIDTGNMKEIAYFENAEDNLIKLIKACQI